jgi:hypothetical protein
MPVHYTVPEPLRLAGRYLSSTDHIDALPLLDTHQLAWAAGFFDGEGCTYLGKHGRQGLSTPCCEVNQIHCEVLHRFQVAVGGLGSMRLRPDTTNKRPNTMWSFYTRNWRSTQAVLTLLWPHLDVVKRAQAARVFAAYQAQATTNPKLGQARMRKLVLAQIEEIRARFAAGGVSKIQLGKDYGVTDVRIGQIVRGLGLIPSDAVVWKDGQGWTS